MKPPIKIEDVVKNEVKSEAVEPSNIVAATPLNSGTGAIGQVAPKKEEEYDSSATVSLKEILLPMQLHQYFYSMLYYYAKSPPKILYLKKRNVS